MQTTSLVPFNNTLGGNATMAAELQKAVTVGYPNLPGSTGSALQAQALDPVVVNLAYQTEELRLRRKMTVTTVNSTVAQYAELNSYGDAPADSVFMPEVGTPQPNNANVLPRYTALKHMGLRGAVSFAAMQTAGGSIVDPLNFETRNLVMRMLQIQEENNFNGNSALSPVQYDGLITQALARAPSTHVRDLRGQSLTQDEIMNASAVVGNIGNHGTLTDLFLNTQCKGDLGRSLIAGQRNLVDNNSLATNQTILGLDPTHVRGTKGLIELNPTPFLTDGGSPAVSTTGNVQFVPAVPTISGVAAAAPASGQTSKFNTTADVGDVSYVVVACNSFGTSAPVYATPGATTAVAQGQVVNLTITPGAGNLADYYAIYRIPTNAPSLDLFSHKLILKVPNTDSNGIAQNAVVTISDTNAKLPGTYDAIAFDMTPNSDFVQMVQTGSMARVPMGIQQTAFEFMVTQTCAPRLRAPRRVFVWQNVGLLKALPQPV